MSVSMSVCMSVSMSVSMSVCMCTLHYGILAQLVVSNILQYLLGHHSEWFPLYITQKD